MVSNVWPYQFRLVAICVLNAVERRVRDHARSIHVLQYSPILQSYCMTGSADGDIRIWVSTMTPPPTFTADPYSRPSKDIRDLSRSIMRIHHPAAVRAVAFSPVSSQSRHVVAALDNGSIYRLRCIPTIVIQWTNVLVIIQVGFNYGPTWSARPNTSSPLRSRLVY